jgi:hypothetical protein
VCATRALLRFPLPPLSLLCVCSSQSKKLRKEKADAAEDAEAKAKEEEEALKLKEEQGAEAKDEEEETKDGDSAGVGPGGGDELEGGGGGGGADLTDALLGKAATEDEALAAATKHQSSQERGRQSTLMPGMAEVFPHKDGAGEDMGASVVNPMTAQGTAANF